MSAIESNAGGADAPRRARGVERKVVELGASGPAGASRAPAAGLGGAPPASAAAPTGSKPAFQVLLEQLSRRARELQESAEAVEKPDELAGAVDRARASLDEALSLKDRLLEAWRAERATRTSPETDAR